LSSNLREVMYKAAKYLWATYFLNKDEPVLTEKERVAIAFLDPKLDVKEQEIVEHKYFIKFGEDTYYFEFYPPRDSIKIYRCRAGETKRVLYGEVPMLVLSEI